MRCRSFFSVAVVLVLLTAGCSSTNETSSDGSSVIEQKLAQVEAQLAEVTAERDALMATGEPFPDRYERSQRTQETVIAIMADPLSFGSEDEVLDLLDTLAVPSMIYGDDAFGTAAWRPGWRTTLFGQADATITTWKSWLSSDGSSGGSLFSWSGSAKNGEPFALIGIELSSFNDDGLYNTITVFYPYDDDEVLRRFREGN